MGEKAQIGKENKTWKEKNKVLFMEWRQNDHVSIRHLGWAKKRVAVIFRETLQGQYTFFPIIITTIA